MDTKTTAAHHHTPATATLPSPLTLQNPRHESFALALAQGLSPDAAYRAAGFSDNNRRARAHQLAQDPDILGRIAHLRACLPQIDALRDRFAPSLLLMPETKEQMIGWLWQVMNGTRKILPIQLRAATLFIRLNGWHLPLLSAQVATESKTETETETTPKSQPPTVLRDEQRHLLAHLNQHILATDSHHRPTYAKDIAAFYSTMADLALLNAPPAESAQDPTTPVATDTTPPIAIPQKSPSINIDPQPLSTPQSPNGDKSASPPSTSQAPPTLLPAPSPRPPLPLLSPQLPKPSTHQTTSPFTRRFQPSSAPHQTRRRPNQKFIK